MADRGARRKIVSKIDPDKPYPMTRANLGHAIIINNVVNEMPGSMEDVEALKTTYQKVGFKVQVHTNCSAQEMRKLKRWIMDNKNHEDSNTFLLTIICHGNKQGHLLDTHKHKAWDTEDFIGDLSEVEALMGKPKILTIQCCRGTQYSKGRPIPRGTSADEEDLEPPHIVADKADLFLAYATVPGYIAFGGDEHGSTYLQAFATYLREEYLQRPLDRIYLMVKQHMARTQQGSEGFNQCSEERNSLTHVLHFGQFHGVNTSPMQKSYEDEVERLKREMERQEKEMERERREMRAKMEKMKTSDVAVLKKSKADQINDRKLDLLCSCCYDCCLLSIYVQIQEHLVVGCEQCKDIKLLNLKTQKVTKAFSSSYGITSMCHGERDRLYVYVNSILELDCSDLNFKTIQTIPTDIDICSSLCYVPSPHNLIIATYAFDGKIKAISTQSKKLVWMVDRSVIREIAPQVCIFLPRHNTVLVSDFGANRIVALNPRDGSHTKNIPIGNIRPINLCLHNDQVFGMGIDEQNFYSFFRFSIN